jgi:serine/threonine protein kinase
MTYRPIEILLGYDKFGISQDIWSIGCIMLFLSCKDIIIFGNNEIEQIFSIYTVLGFPNSKILSKLPHFKNTYPKWTNILKKYINDDVYDLVYQMLNYDFNKRISTEQILQHKYFI